MEQEHSISKKNINTILKAACLRNKNKKLSHIQRDDHFTMEDVDRILKEYRTSTPISEKTTSETCIPKKIPANLVQGKRVLKAASLSDILGFNLQQDQTAMHSSQSSIDKVPEEWKAYYTKLVQLRDKLRKSTSSLTQSRPIKNMQEQESEDHLTFLASSDKEILKEVEAAIERIFEGTYGICEITGKPILKKRLESIPYTRYSVEGQERIETIRRSRQLAQFAGNSVRIADDEVGSSDSYYETDSDAEV
ncbi:MAG: TraR/DksA family transcriptional regulator [Puniceicoccales bacterium]|jgi:RNA polymerase-binding transcription factor DksA|nr:TraR/DksA family transcriptional regulator [Puniceicoccales bacterium]